MNKKYAKNDANIENKISSKKLKKSKKNRKGKSSKNEPPKLKMEMKLLNQMPIRATTITELPLY